MSGLLNWTSLVNKGYIKWHNCFGKQRVISNVQDLARMGNQSEHRIWFNSSCLLAELTIS